MQHLKHLSSNSERRQYIETHQIVSTKDGWQCRRAEPRRVKKGIEVPVIREQVIWEACLSHILMSKDKLLYAQGQGWCWRSCRKCYCISDQQMAFEFGQEMTAFPKLVYLVLILQLSYMNWGIKAKGSCESFAASAVGQNNQMKDACNHVRRQEVKKPVNIESDYIEWKTMCFPNDRTWFSLQGHISVLSHVDWGGGGEGVRAGCFWVPMLVLWLSKLFCLCMFIVQRISRKRWHVFS